MQKLLIVGYADSGSQQIEAILHTHGMSEALPSRNQSLSAQEIATHLLKSKNVIFNETHDFYQMEPAKIWNELALDLLLGNIEQDFWGWNDPQSLFLLEYWQSIEPSLKYILVYSAPQTSIAANFKDKSITKEILQQEATRWTNYHKAIAQFYIKNPESAILVHADQVASDYPQFIGSVSKLIDQPIAKREPADFQESNQQTNKTDLILAQSLIKPLDHLQDSYEALQAIASLPFKPQKKSLNLYLAAWNDLHDPKKINVSDIEEENELLLLQLHQVQEELQYYFLENQQIKAGGAAISTRGTPLYGAGERIKRQLCYRLGSIMIKNSRNLTGILTMPWALIKESQQFSRERAEQGDQKLPPPSQYQDYYEAESVKRHLSYRLGTALIENTKSPLGWFKLPFALTQAATSFNKERGMQ